MLRAPRNPQLKIDASSDGVLPGSGEKDSDIEIQLIEIVRALARAAARRDHRKALEAETMPSSEAGP